MQKTGKLKKKATAIGMQFIIVLIPILVFSLVAFMFLGNFKAFGENLSDYQICKNSNIENARLKLKISNYAITEKNGNLCTTEYITIEEEKELETIAKKMAGCWDMYLEGKEELFETEDGTFCAFCSVLEFETEESISGLTEYLMETTIPNKGGISYYEYLTRMILTDDVIKQFGNAELLRKGTIDTSKPQAIIFVMGKDANPGAFIEQSSIQTAVQGQAIGSVVGLTALAGMGLCANPFGFVICSAGAFLVGGTAGATTGYFIGSDSNPELDSRILLWEYSGEALQQLQCTHLEGKDTLTIRK